MRPFEHILSFKSSNFKTIFVMGTDYIVLNLILFIQTHVKTTHTMVELIFIVYCVNTFDFLLCNLLFISSCLYRTWCINIPQI